MSPPLKLLCTNVGASCCPSVTSSLSTVNDGTTGRTSYGSGAIARSSDIGKLLRKGMGSRQTPARCDLSIARYPDARPPGDARAVTTSGDTAGVVWHLPSGAVGLCTTRRQMVNSIRRVSALLAVAGLAVVVGCGSSSGASSTTTTSGAPPTTGSTTTATNTQSSATASTGTSTTATAQNLQVTNALRAELVAAGAASHNLPA